MSKTSKDDRYSVPEQNAGVKASWEAFINDAMPSLEASSLQATNLRHLIHQSWVRCQTDHVDPMLAQASFILSEDGLEALRQRHARLIDASTPCMAQSHDILSPTGTVMILTDPNGTILDVEGDASARVRDPLQATRLVPGGRWSESEMGTNAIGTALQTGQPVQIHAAEHFCEGIQRWTCSATVIRDPIDNAILGVIDVSGLSQNYSRHSLALAMTTAARIESRLSRQEMEHRYHLVESGINKLATKSGNGYLLFDQRGYLVKADGRATPVLVGAGFKSMNSPVRIDALNLDTPEHERPACPDWLLPEWVEPVIKNGHVIGSIVHIPTPCLTSFRTKSSSGRKPDAAGLDGIIGQSPPLIEALNKAHQLAKARVPVLLLGETGVGKELFAKGIHQASRDEKEPFVALNCGGLSKDLLSSELFGYADGAFTGARKGGLAGKIEAADGGTLFLDEIGEMPMDIQPHLLRVLESGEIYRLGENAPRRVRFRLIAATNRDLRMSVDEGLFRMDLFYRIAVTSIRIPPLKDRVGDIPLLTDWLIRHLCQHHELPLKTLPKDVLSMLEAYSWPGNVRELRNIIESMLLMSTSDTLAVEDLPPEIATPLWTNRPSHASGLSECSPLEQAESHQIRTTLHQCQGNLTLVAQKLGIAKSTLYLKLKKYGLTQEVDAIRAGH